jgi:hypothetical protein
MNVASSILKDLGYSDDRALRDFALLQASQKHAELKLEDNFFEKKYKMNFSAFEQSLKSTTEEKFELEDDYLDWKFAHEGAGYWLTQLDMLRRAS